MSRNVIAWTGHRPDKLGGYAADNPVKFRAKRKAETIIKTLEPDGCIVGMALGFDTWVAEVCVRLGCPWLAAIPFPGQEKRWPQVAQEHYLELLALATKVITVSPGPYSPHLMQVRNEWMVDHSTLLVALWDGSKGGTANCIAYAEKIGRETLRIEL